MNAAFGHCASQYPVPYAGPAGFSSLFPPPASISEKYKAPFDPHGILLMSTSKVNSFPRRLNMSYEESFARRYTRGDASLTLPLSLTKSFRVSSLPDVSMPVPA
jgi:hypothetical protein